MELRLPELELDTGYEHDLFDLLDGMDGLKALHLTAASISPKLYNMIAAKQLSYFQFDRIPRQLDGDYAFAIVSLHSNSKVFINADPRLYGVPLPIGITSVGFQVVDVAQIQSIGTNIGGIYKRQRSFTATSISVGVRPDREKVDNFIRVFFDNVVSKWAQSRVLVDVSLICREFVVEMTKPTIITDRVKVKIRLTIYDTSYILGSMESCVIEFRHYWSVTIASDFPSEAKRVGFKGLSYYLGDIAPANDKNAYFVLQMTANLEELQIDSPGTFKEFITSYASNVEMLRTAFELNSFENLVVLVGFVQNAKEMENIPFSVLKEQETPLFIYVQSIEAVADDQALLRPDGYQATVAANCRRANDPNGICLEKMYTEKKIASFI